MAEPAKNGVGQAGMIVQNASGSPVPQLTPGPLRQMLGEAIRHVKSLPCDAAQRAAAFEALAKHFADTFSRIGLPRPYETL